MEKRSLGATNHEKLFPVLEELGITFVAFSPLANGLFKRSIQESSNFHGDGRLSQHDAAVHDWKKILPQRKFIFRRKKSQTLTLNLTL